VQLEQGSFHGSKGTGGAGNSATCKGAVNGFNYFVPSFITERSKY
jgi:hypothetical protein